MSGRGLEFLSWFKRSPGVGDGGAAGLLWLDHCPWHQQSLGMTLHFVLLLFLLAKRGCSQAGQSTVRMGGGAGGWEKPTGVHPCCPPKAA